MKLRRSRSCRFNTRRPDLTRRPFLGAYWAHDHALYSVFVLATARSCRYGVGRSASNRGCGVSFGIWRVRFPCTSATSASLLCRRRPVLSPARRVTRGAPCAPPFGRLRRCAAMACRFAPARVDSLRHIRFASVSSAPGHLTRQAGCMGPRVCPALRAPSPLRGDGVPLRSCSRRFPPLHPICSCGVCARSSHLPGGLHGALRAARPSGACAAARRWRAASLLLASIPSATSASLLDDCPPFARPSCPSSRLMARWGRRSLCKWSVGNGGRRASPYPCGLVDLLSSPSSTRTRTPSTLTRARHRLHDRSHRSDAERPLPTRAPDLLLSFGHLSGDPVDP